METSSSKLTKHSSKPPIIPLSFTMQPSTLLNLHNQQPITTQKLSISCPILNHFLSGGIPCTSITEIVAESGSGKTQFCLQLLLSSQLPASHGGFSSSSLFLHTEFPFTFRRLRQLSLSFLDSYKPLFSSSSSSSFNPLDKVLVQPVHDAHQLFDVLLKLDSFLVRRNSSQWPVKLIVIDSIAAVFRSDFDNTPLDLKSRSSFFFKISAKLRELAQKFGLAVVITNQVVDFVENNDGLNGFRVGNLGSLYTSGRRVCPALGLAWANCVNTRLFISRSEEVVEEKGKFVEEDGRLCVSRKTKRRIHVVFAPHLPHLHANLQSPRKEFLGLKILIDISLLQNANRVGQ